MPKSFGLTPAELEAAFTKIMADQDQPDAVAQRVEQLKEIFGGMIDDKTAREMDAKSREIMVVPILRNILGLPPLAAPGTTPGLD